MRFVPFKLLGAHLLSIDAPVNVPPGLSAGWMAAIGTASRATIRKQMTTLEGIHLILFASKPQNGISFINPSKM